MNEAQRKQLLAAHDIAHALKAFMPLLPTTT